MKRYRYPEPPSDSDEVRMTRQQNRDSQRRRSSGASLTCWYQICSYSGAAGFSSVREG